MSLNPWSQLETYLFAPFEAFLSGHAWLEAGFRYAAIFWMAIWVLWVLRGVYRVLTRSVVDLKKRYGGGWCIVTGAANNIGQAFCHEIAKQGLNLILMD